MTLAAKIFLGRMGAKLRPWHLAALGLVLGALVLWTLVAEAYQRGHAAAVLACELAAAETQAQLNQRTLDLQLALADLRLIQAARDAQLEGLRHETHLEAGSADLSLSVDGVQRLHTRWGSN
jgi:hypothetical protein